MSVTSAGVEVAASDLHLDPTLASGEEDRFFNYFPALAGKRLFPLGEVHGGHAFLGIDPDGVIYQLMDDAWFVASTFDDALRVVLRGFRITRLGRSGAA